MKFKGTKKDRHDFQTKVIAGLKDAVKELNELYEEARAEYEALEAVTEELQTLAEELYPKLGRPDGENLQNLLAHWNKVNSLVRNNVRDIRDVLRNQKKRLKELQNEI